MEVTYSDRIPNNVGLHDNRRLQRALEAWQPRYLDWWHQMGPESFDAAHVYLRTATDVGRGGWANFDWVRLPEYRWGIFLADPEPDRRVGFGEHRDDPAWQEVPGEYRNQLRRLIVVQGDTEPASVEQQRDLGKTCPSLYDLRNLFQVNVEEGRHLWAMVYLLDAHFGRDGREEAEALLERHAGDADRPRILAAFNEPTTDWLSFFMFTHFTDRDGRFQLEALSESGFDPLARTCQFMLREEAHHMFVGTTGVGRVVQRSCELMREGDTDDLRPLGGIDLHLLQKYINFHFSVSIDLFGGETSSNAASYFSSGLKGRFHERQRSDDHRLLEATYALTEVGAQGLRQVDVPALTAINEGLRDDYIANCQKGLDRWNVILAEQGIATRFTLPHRGFHRSIGIFAGHPITPTGQLVSPEAWAAARDEWLPTDADRAYVHSVMRPVVEPGRIAGWIAPPASGIDDHPVDFEYVRL